MTRSCPARTQAGFGKATNADAILSFRSPPDRPRSTFRVRQMPRRSHLFLLLPCAFVMAVATAQPRQPTPAQSEALRDDSGVIREQPLSSGQVTGRVEVPVRAGETPVTIRSIAPTGGGQYRIVFTDLDLDGDGFISRSEAAANPSLEAEFDALDSRRRGQLDRADLAGWLVD
mgnify:CR=1 FL=1